MRTVSFLVWEKKMDSSDEGRVLENFPIFISFFKVGF